MIPAQTQASASSRTVQHPGALGDLIVDDFRCVLARLLYDDVGEVDRHVFLGCPLFSFAAEECAEVELVD